MADSEWRKERHQSARECILEPNPRARKQRQGWQWQALYRLFEPGPFNLRPRRPRRQPRVLGRLFLTPPIDQSLGVAVELPCLELLVDDAAKFDRRTEHPD